RRGARLAYDARRVRVRIRVSQASRWKRDHGNDVPRAPDWVGGAARSVPARRTCAFRCAAGAPATQGVGGLGVVRASESPARSPPGSARIAGVGVEPGRRPSLDARAERSGVKAPGTSEERRAPRRGATIAP